MAFGTVLVNPQQQSISQALLDRHYLRNKHLIPMVRDGLLKFRYPESAGLPAPISPSRVGATLKLDTSLLRTPPFGTFLPLRMKGT
mgnify:CR=1 FL=1